MAHELSFKKDGTAEAMFAGQKPWHGLGTMVTELQKPHDALTLANLNWEVQKRPVYFGQTKTEYGVITDKVAYVRSDTGAYLGTVGNDWVPVQNAEQAQFIEDLVGTGEAVVECLGALRGGKRIFWTCRLPDRLKVADGDEVEKYLILANGHDGHLAFRAFWSPIRVVCANTLNAALAGVKDSVVLYHRLDVKDRTKQARQLLGLANQYYDKLGKVFQQMLAVSIGETEFRSYVEHVFPVTLDENEQERKPSKAVAQARAKVTANFAGGKGAEMAGSTVWGAYNAVTEYVDHAKEYGEKDASTEDRKTARFEQVMLESGKRVQNRAFEAALELAGIK